jgi:RNA polymerase sigma factor (sigma-70 family)
MSATPEISLSVLLRLRNRDDCEAWSCFDDLCRQQVYRQARPYRLCDADTNDCAQEVLLAAARNIQRYDPNRAPICHWLGTIITRKLRSLCKQRRRAPEAIADQAEVPAANDPDERWEWEYRQRLFAAAAEIVRNQVDPLQWRVYWRAAVDGEAGAVVAAECGVKVEQVYVIRHRVQKRMVRVGKRLVDTIAGLNEE